MNRNDIERICSLLKITPRTIHPDGTVDVNGTVGLNFRSLMTVYNEGLGTIGKLPLKFGRVSRNFHATTCNLDTLDGAPHTVLKTVDISGNPLVNLIGGPKTVGGSYICNNCTLETLEGAPVELAGGYFDCRDNNLTNLVGAPKKLTAKSVGLARFECNGNPLKTFCGVPREFSYISAPDTMPPYHELRYLLLSKISLSKGCTLDEDEFEIIFSGRVDGVMPSELIPGKIAELKELDRKNAG